MQALKLRAELYALIRRFFAQRGVLEVETPILSSAGNTDPNIESFSTLFSGPVIGGINKRWLRTSPEYALKRLLAAGIGDCYELGRVFRNGEAGARHNPEFTMLEWYRLGFDHHDLMAEIIDLIREAIRIKDKNIYLDFVKISYIEFFVEKLDIDPFSASLSELQSTLKKFHISPDGLTRDDWLDLLFTHCIQPNFPEEQLLLLYDYPASQCALAKIRADKPPVAERFEVFLGKLELANGYHELTDPEEQLMRFEHDNQVRTERRQSALPIDHHLLNALRRGIPECAGVALGIERLLMYLLGTEDIRDVLAFSFDNV